MSLKEKGGLNFAFPTLMFHSQTGDLNELKQLVKGDKVVIYGRFYNLKKSDFSVEVDVVEKLDADRIDRGVTVREYTGGHDRTILLDARVSPTPTPTATVTPTPGLSVWKRINNLVSPKETVTVTGTVTPDAN